MIELLLTSSCGGLYRYLDHPEAHSFCALFGLTTFKTFAFNCASCCQRCQRLQTRVDTTPPGGMPRCAQSRTTARTASYTIRLLPDTVTTPAEAPSGGQSAAGTNSCNASSWSLAWMGRFTGSSIQVQKLALLPGCSIRSHVTTSIISEHAHAQHIHLGNCMDSQVAIMSVGAATTAVKAGTLKMAFEKEKNGSVNCGSHSCDGSLI